ncbi:MAG: hypothetical protein K2X38_19975 [Gemmataceae bacterium]|nr:hypothetical protein [Gemmataceae bacterium]
MAKKKPKERFISLDDALAQNPNGISFLAIPNMTPAGWEPVAGVAAGSAEVMNTLTELAHRLQHSGEIMGLQKAYAARQTSDTEEITIANGPSHDNFTEGRSPSEWRRLFRISPDTLSRRFKANEIRNIRVHSKLYRVHIDDLPHDEKKKYRP